MNADRNRPRDGGFVVLKVIAWMSWVAFLLVSIGQCAFATAVRKDVYFDRYYRLHPMSDLTVVMTAHPVWISLIPLLWLPCMMAYQRRNRPRAMLLLPVVGTMFVVVVAVTVLILCSGPPIQM